MNEQSEHYLWVERFRPRSVSDCILPERLKQFFQSQVDAGSLQNMLLLGGPGTGKTTAAKAMCNQMGIDVLFINASEQGGIDTLRTLIRGFASTVSFIDGAHRCVILDEADFMNCFSGDQLIKVVDHNKIVEKPLSELEDKTVTVLSYDFECGEVITNQANVFCSGEQEVFEVEFEDGTIIYCTKDHPFFTETGQEQLIGEGVELFAIE